MTTLKWDNSEGGGGDSFVLADESGAIEVWRRNTGDITHWSLVAKTLIDR